MAGLAEYCEQRSERQTKYDNAKKVVEVLLDATCEAWDAYIAAGGEPNAPEGVEINTEKTLLEVEYKYLCEIVGIE